MDKLFFEIFFAGKNYFVLVIILFQKKFLLLEIFSLLGEILC